jgi:tetratricopeptide (TPR) repeat protein
MLVPAKCPDCGGFVEVDSEKRLGICQHCGNPFVVEEAVQTFNTYYNTTNNYNTNHNYGEGAVVNVYENQNSVDSFIKRAFTFLGDGSFAKADEYCEKVLDIDPENAQAYLIKFMSQMQIRHLDELKNSIVLFENNSSYQKLIRFCNDALSKKLEDYAAFVRNRRASLENELVFINNELHTLYQLIDYERQQRQMKNITESIYYINLRQLKSRQKYLKQFFNICQTYEVHCPICGTLVHLADNMMVENESISCPLCGADLGFETYWL